MNSFWLIGFLFSVAAGNNLKINSHGNNHLFDYQSILTNSSQNQISIHSSTWLRFVLNFAAKSQWTSVVLFFSTYSEFTTNFFPLLMKYLNFEGRFVKILSTSRPHLPHSILQHGRKLGIVYYCDVPDEDFLNKVSELDFFDSYRFWLFIQPEFVSNKGKLEDILRNLNFGINSNVVIAKMERRTGVALLVTSSTQISQTTKNIVLQKSVVKRKKRELASDLMLIIHLKQIYKAGKTDNETLAIDLGFWDVSNELYHVRNIINEEQRQNLGGYKVYVGIKNSTKNFPEVPLKRFAAVGKAYEEKNFMELFDCLTFGINASFELVKFQRLGWRNEEGGWTHLLGGVVDETVDFALETVDIQTDVSGDMSFSYAIITTMNNIYFCRSSTGGMRDIFLAPFSVRLILCVLGTGFLLAIAMVFITTIYCRKNSSRKNLVVSKHTKKTNDSVPNEKKSIHISDAILWSVGILCMQGSQWSPKTVSGNLLLIHGLLFALVIYNSFAAFITSVLSVKNLEIKDLKDLAGSDLAFGYTLGNADELFLRTVNNTLLRELYFKGLRENDGVSDPMEGMHRAAQENYAFFVSARTARRALRTVVAHDKRCRFQELYVTLTKNYASIPLSRKSSLKKVVNSKIIRLMETGILRRFQELVLLSMPSCLESTKFNSARLADVYSAFFLLAGGWAISLVLLLIEIFWWRKKKSTNARTIRQLEKFNSSFKGESLKDMDLYYYK